MCGIVGYVGEKEATPILINSLKKLEYRGYDSSGIAIINSCWHDSCNATEPIIVRKCKGAIKFLEEKIESELVKGAIHGNVGIAHTRWATHGEPSDLNAHPHTDVSGTIAVVHNGIIENYSELKAWLQSKGVVFKSQTDTEVIAHLLNYFYTQTADGGHDSRKTRGDIFASVRAATQKLVGSYALGVVCRDFPDRLICARKESPLIVGLGKNENFIASDVPAVLEYTREVYFLEQNEMAVLYTDHVDLFTSEGEKIVRSPSHVDWDISSAEKGGYAHFMLKEIFEQPKALHDTLASHLICDKNGNPRTLSFSDEIDDADFEKMIQNAKRIVITACGTAYHAGMVGKYAFEKYARIPTLVDVASEFRYRDPILEKDDVFIVVSQSGETADTLAALRLAKSRGSKVIAITNCVGSTVSRESDYVIYTLAGPEIAVASTKAYTTQLMCLYMLSILLGKVRGVISSPDFANLLSELEAIPENAQKILDNQTEIQKFASCQFNKEKIFYIGRQFDSANSLESALKLKEVSYMHCEAFSAGELKHGPIALVDKNTLVIAIATEPSLYEKLISNIIEVKSRGAATMVITNDSTGSFDDCCDSVIQIPSGNSEFSNALESMLSVIPAQLFAYYCSVLRGNDPDKPRNLAKSVTVE